MKKMFCTVLMAVVICGFMACGNSKAPATEQAENEQTAVEVVVDSVESDTTATATRGGTESEGFGRCSQCKCPAFEGRGDICKNCGHNYRKHY